MFELIRAHQLNAMLLLCGGCMILAFLLLHTQFLSKSRRRILILMELVAFFLLWFDRLAYVYAGDQSPVGYYMVRISNFFVFFMTSAVVFGFNLYLSDLLLQEGKLSERPARLTVSGAMALVGMVLATVSAFTNLYYYFDEANVYHRGRGFLIAYIIPVFCPILQYTVIRQYKKRFSKLIYLSLVLYIFVPIACGILQIFTYGISIVNMAMAVVSVSLYIFMYLDLNRRVAQTHETEMQTMQEQKKRMERLFDQTAKAFVFAVEKKDPYREGNAAGVAALAKRIAKEAGKSESDCEKVYYAALLHDVGLAGIPDAVIVNDADPKDRHSEAMRKRPVIGAQILEGITEYPYLAEGAHYSHERYNGTGYPEGLKGDAIPEIARIIAVADAYISMMSKKRYRNELPHFVVREEFVKGSGEKYDPVFADIMVKLIDEESNERAAGQAPEIEKEITCKAYREQVSHGIAVENACKLIRFTCTPLAEAKGSFSAPSIVLFDSFDGRTHDDEKSIEGYHYLEYGEIWFDAHSITTAARAIEERELPASERLADDGNYEIIAGRYEDHVKLIMRTKQYAKEVTIALLNTTNDAHIGLTGENCSIREITTEKTGESYGASDIQRIAEPVSFIDHLEADLKNVQIDRWRSASTQGVAVRGRTRLRFHTMTLPGATLIWHCPYIVLFTSDDGNVGGPNYREFQMIKLNGEDDGKDKPCKNRFVMKKSADFPGWDVWKEKNKEGMECEVTVERKGGQILLRTDNLGLKIENSTTDIPDATPVYVALTGDQVALTDIRVQPY